MTVSATCAIDEVPRTHRQLTNAPGVVTDTYEYDAFGSELNSTGSTPNPYLYRGEFFDSDLGLYYLRARWMNPLTGRFMSRDAKDHGPTNSKKKPVRPTDPRLLHRYLYAMGDPVNVIDPLGLEGAEEYEIDTYRSLKKATAFTDLEAHHIIQARFAPLFNVDPEDMMAIAVSNLEHSALDLAWMDAIPYGTTAAATQGEVLGAALDIYVDYPDVYDWLMTAWEIE
jgi:RHS repeat-associated protein